jgi:hypothetical protein
LESAEALWSAEAFESAEALESAEAFGTVFRTTLALVCTGVGIICVAIIVGC